MNAKELDARSELVKHLGELIDPKYANDKEKAERLLREAVRKVYIEHGQHLPSWVKNYVAKWSKDRQLLAQDDNQRAVFPDASR